MLRKIGRRVWDLLQFLKTALRAFIEDDALSYAASLAFYTALSLGPLVVIALWLASIIAPVAQVEVREQLTGLVGPEAGPILSEVVAQAQGHQQSGTITAVLGIGVLLAAATLVFGQLQKAMNAVWDIQPQPRSDILRWLRVRGMSLILVIVLWFLLLISLGATAALDWLLGDWGWAWTILNWLIGVAVYMLIFSLLYKVLPDADVEWRVVWVGALITAVLFDVGQWVIGKWLGWAGIGWAYGAAGSVVVLLVWVYYSSIIVLFGAELTQVYSRKHGRAIRPAKHASWEAGYQPRGATEVDKSTPPQE